MYMSKILIITGAVILSHYHAIYLDKIIANV